MPKKILATSVAFAVVAVAISVPAFADTRTAGASSGAVIAPVVTMPEAPIVSAPVAPTLSADTMSAQTAGGGTTSAGSTTAKASSSKAASSSGSAKTASSSASGTSASALSLLGLGSDNALLKALSGTGSDDAGLDALSSLLGGGSSAKTGTSTDQATLDKILALLERQQAERDSASASGSATGSVTASSSGTAAVEKPRIESGGELVRFSVNGYDILSSVKTEVSSVLARDGSFLITCDRSYSVSGRKLTETFYFLCRKAGKSAYRLYADVSQPVPNPNSFPYRLSRKTPLTGTLTGDLLVFRSSDAELKLDLVIRVINPTDR